MIEKLFKRQEIRFLFVGGLNTVVGYGLYALLLFLNINYLIANTFSTIIGVLHSYLWNRYFTFKSREKASKELLKFISVYILSYLIGMGTLFCFKEIFNISPYLAGLLNLIITTLISWFGHKYFSFKKQNTSIIEFVKKYKIVFISLGIFVLSFCLLLMYKNVGEFTDEGDVMLGAKFVSEGKLIYKDFASQHLPFTYYIFAPFALLGVNSIVGFRLCMYFLLAFIWAGMFIRYNKDIGKLPMILYPLLYIVYMSVPDFYGTTVLSEHIESQCLVIIFLEIVLFYKNKKIDTLGKILIPLAMVIAIGSAFVSIIPCFIAVLTLFYLDIKYYLKNNKKSFWNYFKHFFKEYKLLIIVGFGLVILFLMYLLFTGTLLECYKQAFYLNTEVYSKYNGYSSNPLKTILLIIPNFLLSLPAYFNFNFINILYLLLAIAVIFFFYNCWRKEKIVAVLLLLFVLLGGNRSFENFHAIPYYALAIISFLYSCNKLNKKQWGIIVLIIFVIFIKNCSKYIISFKLENNTNTRYYELLKKLNNDEYFSSVNVNTPIYINLDLDPYGRFSGMVPWFAEIYEDEYLANLQKVSSNIILYNPYDEVWGYKYKDFMPKINNYIINNYTFDNNYKIWLKKGYIDDAEKILDKDLAEYNNSYGLLVPFALQNNYVEQIVVPKNNVYKIGFKFGTYNRDNYSLLKIEIMNQDGLVLEKTISTKVLKDNSFLYLDVDLQQYKEYTIKIWTENTNNYDYVAIYKTNDDFNLDNNYLKINSMETKEDLVMEMYYE